MTQIQICLLYTSVEMKFLRAAEGCLRSARVRNDYMRAALYIGELVTTAYRYRIMSCTRLQTEYLGQQWRMHHVEKEMWVGRS